MKVKKCAIVDVKGGLGNQIFTISFAQYLKNNDLKLSLNINYNEYCSQNYYTIRKLNIKFFANENQNLLVNGQKSFLYQAFDNIIMNAASFSPSGGIIEIVLSSTENYLSVSISDEGPGIKDPNIKRIFDRFYSFRDNKSDQGHSGLGLSIAKQIIDAHDGYISADNVIEGGNIMGAKFIVNLPLAD